MNPVVQQTSANSTLVAAKQTLLASRRADGHWTGHLSSSALSTATGVVALHLYCKHASPDSVSELEALEQLTRRGIDWIADHQNKDGGWGDTTASPSNISTTTLCWAALSLYDSDLANHRTAREAGQSWINKVAGGTAPKQLSTAILRAYGNDRSFSVPILTMCALSGVFGEGRGGWRCIPALPFELAMVPHALYSLMRLPVVSYALPALIAIGQARHHHRPTRNPATRFIRTLARKRTLRILERIQPASGGFLEAAPLTSFVAMSLAGSGQADHAVTRRGIRFLVESARDDGSWPIDTNLATWLTTLSINALAGGHGGDAVAPPIDAEKLLPWLLHQQTKTEHPYSHADPGAWAWTDLTGGVPDADDTAGALIALHHLDRCNQSQCEPRASARADPRRDTAHGTHVDNEIILAARKGTTWLANLQNKDGGIPTFCKGWGKFPFDRSSPDLTAHALRAWHTWRDKLTGQSKNRTDRAMSKAIAYLLRQQSPDGSWVPLWFGNQHAANQLNPLYGTSRVLRAAHAVNNQSEQRDKWNQAINKAVAWVVAGQNTDGGWGGASSAPSTIEETALAIESLASVLRHSNHENSSLTMDDRSDSMHQAIARGVGWLTEHTHNGTRFPAAPIGLYFAKLWYDERLYPIIFTVAALEQVGALEKPPFARAEES